MAACSSPDAGQPVKTKDGLVQVDHPKAKVTAIYVREGIDLNDYKHFLIADPFVIFKTDWLERTNLYRPNDPLTGEDVMRMVDAGKEMLKEEFTKAIKAAGYDLVTREGTDVIKLRVTIMDLDVYAPDPNGTNANEYSQTYTRGAGEATLLLELFNAASGELLARVVDRKSQVDIPNQERLVYTRDDNIYATRAIFAYWAELFANGFEAVRSDEVQLAPRVKSK